MPKVEHFDITADDPEKEITFFKNVFGWKFEKWNGPMEYWNITTGSPNEQGINGGLSKRAMGMGNVNTIGVPNLDEYVRKIERAGGKITQKKMPIPGVGWYASFTDPQGNNWGIMQDDKNAR